MHKKKVHLMQPVFIITGPYIFMRQGEQEKIDLCVEEAQKAGNLPSKDKADRRP